ncbi:MAG TPA: hypothetical protein GXX72_07635 [Clostridiaceae bacterium]|nr:hypothetical protein [Clostridiaceae bacterium]
MKQFLRNLKGITVLLVLLVIALLVGLFIQQRRSQEKLSVAAGENKYALARRYSRAGNILSSDGVLLAHNDKQERKYADDPELARACLHLIGDYTHRINSGIESVYMPELLGSSRSFLDQLLLDIRGKGFGGNDLVLTADSRLMLYADKLLGKYQGSVVLLNYRTGDVLALVNSPRLYPRDVIEWKNIVDGSLFNRALYGRYLPGSTFKIVATAAMLEDSDFDREEIVSCKGAKPIVPAGAKEILTPKGHGKVSLQKAFPLSCNAYYGLQAIGLGSDRLTTYAEKFGYNQDLYMDRYKIAGGSMTLTEPGTGALSWAGIGQPIGQDKITISPLHMAAIAGAIANDGLMMKPHIIKQEIDINGTIKNERKVEEYFQCCEVETAIEIQKLMLDTVKKGTGKKARHKGLSIAGKTGTAEMINAEGKKQTNYLFNGYLMSDTHPLAISVVLEKEGNASQLAGKILAYAATLDLP